MLNYYNEVFDQPELSAPSPEQILCNIEDRIEAENHEEFKTQRDELFNLFLSEEKYNAK